MKHTQATEPSKILVVRNDKLGDFMLAWPALATLKAASPKPHITALVPNYTAALARACPWIDDIILDPGDQADAQAQRKLRQDVTERGFDALLTLFSTPRIGWLGWRTGIKLRLAPATKWAQIFYNRRVTQRRSRSQKPEYIYNIELAEALLNELGITLPERPVPPYWPIANDQRSRQRHAITQALGIRAENDADTPWIYLHPGSGGSAVNLTPRAYALLAQDVDSRCRSAGLTPHWIITSGPGEEAIADSLCNTMQNCHLKASRLPPGSGIVAFAHQLSAADMFIAGSTGPLHIAACLDRPTAGFYPSRRSATPLRWQTCNQPARRLAFCPPSDADEADMQSIDLPAAAAQIAQQLTDTFTQEIRE
ncbi:glycosyltransferase family 9 protein [Halomonas halocynthiae]|uniref:glycosyltransferase family 9 protein n=1 Tax=Halomonas halocynthiae TaxID=176290 RepID=UPI0003F9DADC|nr:glycosyltransferase family 9 protein [Halomonas halocynthiae]